MKVSAKLRTLKSARLLNQGLLLAQQTSTLAGICASPLSSVAMHNMMRFKQRQGPFLLLADSLRTALNQAVFITPTLRKMARKSWAGSVTLVFSAKPLLAKSCYQGGCVAIRVDENMETRRLAAATGGLLASSSLNRRGQPVAKPDKQLRYRWQRHVSGLVLSEQLSLGQPSAIFHISGHHIKKLR